MHALALAGICVVGLALRCLVIGNTLSAGVFSDMQDYYDRAVHLLTTGSLAGDAFRSPLFPVFMAGIWKLFGQTMLAPRLAQAALGTLTVALTYLLARHITTRRGALIAASIVAVYPALLLYSVYLLSETLCSFLVVLGIVLWLDRRQWTGLLAGIVVGAALLTRGAGGGAISGIILAEAYLLLVRREQFNRAKALRGALLIVGCSIALGPWVVRNYQIYHRLVLTDTSAGFNVLLGDYPGATGRHPGIPAVNALDRSFWAGAANDLERSDIGLRSAWDFVEHNPARAAHLALHKVGYLLGVEGREHAWLYSYHYQGRRRSAVVWAWGLALLLSFPLLAVPASFGAWRPGLGNSRLGVLLICTFLSVAAIHIVTFGESRFHLPWVPLIALLAARSCADLTKQTWSWRRRVGLALWLCGLAILWGSQVPELLTVLPQLAASPVPLRLPY